MNDINVDVKMDDGYVSKNKSENKSKTIIGKNTDGTAIISAVEGRKHFFISRLKPTTTVEDLTTYLNSKNLTNANCTKLSIRSDTIAAFKVSVAASEANKILDSDLWPKFTIIRPYRYRKQTETPEHFLAVTPPLGETAANKT